MAGLMHDIGVLLLVKADPSAMATFEPPAGADQALARQAERQHLGMDHETAGALIVESWALPAWLKTAVARHHDAAAPCGTGIDVLPCLLTLADRMAAAAGYGLWTRCEGPLDPVLLDSLKLSADDVQALVDMLPEAVDALTTGA
jgi:hypothetical protein